MNILHQYKCRSQAACNYISLIYIFKQINLLTHMHSCTHILLICIVHVRQSKGANLPISYPAQIKRWSPAVCTHTHTHTHTYTHTFVVALCVCGGTDRASLVDWLFFIHLSLSVWQLALFGCNAEN